MCEIIPDQVRNASRQAIQYPIGYKNTGGEVSDFKEKKEQYINTAVYSLLVGEYGFEKTEDHIISQYKPFADERERLRNALGSSYNMGYAVAERALQTELEAVKGELRKYKEGFKNEQHKFGVEFLKNEKLKSQLKTAAEALAFYADQESWSKGIFGLPGCVTNQEDHELISFEGERITCGGLVARTALASIKEGG
jgi:hypothetical protein